MPIHISQWLMAFGLIAGGLIAAASLIVSKKPNAKELLDKLAVHQGYIGVALLGMGAWTLLRILTHLKLYTFFMKIAPTGYKVLFSLLFLSAPIAIVLGILLGAGLFTRFTSNEAAKEQATALRDKLAKFQAPIGVVALLNGLGLLILFLVL
jgi:hypothetical protein